MSMVTSCPACATTFRVTQEQLKLRQGQVRCGKCNGVFDGYKALASLPDDPVTERPERRAFTASAMRAPGLTPLQATLDIGPPSAGTHTGMVSSVAESQADTGAAAQRRRQWAGAIAVLATAVLLQLAYVLRTQISAAAPVSRPWFERLCALTGCTIPPPQRTDALAIEASDLQADPARATVIVLTAAVRNRGNSVVAHPALELTLTNAQDQAIARRVFLPRDYLERASAADTGMAARAEINVRIELDTGDLKPAGYRLFLFYP